MSIQKRPTSTVENILEKIVTAKRQEIAAARQKRPDREIRAAAADAPPPRDFFQPLAAEGSVSLIAEVKKASPSKGVIRADFRPLEIARIYQESGAACLSVLTDQPFFQGSLAILRSVRQTVQLPTLRKDFILHPYQVWEAREAGADAVLLIAECLGDDDLRRLHDAVVEMGMTPLVELYEPENLHRVLDCGTRLVGINNRNLRTFQTDIQHSVRLRAQIPDDRLVVGESGIHSYQDVQVLERAGINAILVGEQLMAAADIGQAVKSLLNQRLQP